MTHFYDIDSSRISHLEYWWGNKSPLVLIGWILKWLRVRIPGSADDANVDSTLPFFTNTLPADIAERFRPLADQLAGLGFHSPLYQIIFDPGTQTTIYWATFLHNSGSCFARLHHRVWQKANKSDRGLFPMFFTEFADGTFLVSSSGKPDMAAPKTIVMEQMHGARLHDLWNVHSQKLEALAQQKNIVPVWTADDLKNSAEREHILLRDFHIARGVFRERTAQQHAEAERLRAHVEQARAQGLEHAEVLAELDRVQNHKPSWAGAVWILVVSAIAFIALGARQWDWKFTLLLLPILFFHEAGHWIAMRVFGYRNLRMFFIPLFGAAVTGRNWNVAGWKKAMVSLAGPLPGIALGVVLAFVNFFIDKPLLNEAALLLIFLNAFNLLPMLPFDGGHVVHATLFCRHRWLDAVFRVLAIVGIVALGMFGGFKLLMYIAIPMGLALPLSIKLGKVTDGLRRQSLPAPAAGEDRIPTETAQAIISAVKEVLPKGSSAKTIATHSAGVFETLNARPPGFFGTFGILTLHGGAVCVSVVVAALLIVHKSGNLTDFFSAAARQPEQSVTCEEIRVFKSNAPAAKGLTAIVATFENFEIAEAFCRSLKDRIPESSQLLLFGQSILLTVPAEDDAARVKWFEELQSSSTNTFVALTNRPVALSLTFIAPNDATAKNLEQELSDYLGANLTLPLIPPWSSEANKLAFVPYQKARRDWLRIASTNAMVWDDPSLKEFDRKILAANRRGDAAEADRLDSDRDQAVKQLQAKAMAALSGPGPENIAPDLVKLYLDFNSIPYTNRTERVRLEQELAGMLGAQPDGASADDATSGFITRQGLLLQIHWAVFRNPVVGLDSFTRWLCTRQCSSFKYELDNGFSVTDLEEED